MKKRSRNRPATNRRAGVRSGRVPIVVVGGSAGGFAALMRMLDYWESPGKIAVLVVLHMAPGAQVSFLVQHLQAHTSLKCSLPVDGEKVKPGTLYLAVPDAHLIIGKGGKILLGKGPDENRFRPSIDVLFRSAAVHFRQNLVAVVVSGMMDDGVAGTMAVQECGGTCIVQDPGDAEFSDLPFAVINRIKADAIQSPEHMGESINHFVQRRHSKRKTKVPTRLMREALVSEKTLTNIDSSRSLGTQALLTCPDCGGTLWHLNDRGLSRYRCFTGHAFTESALLEKQNQSLQLTLWVALRMFEERKELLSRLPSSGGGQRRINELEDHIESLKGLLSDIQKLTLPNLLPNGKKGLPAKEKSKVK